MLEVLTTRIVASLLTLVILGQPVVSEVSSYGQFHFSTDMPDVLILDGEIDADAVYNFRKALREHDAVTLLLNSPGGSVYEALELSAVIADRGIATVIPPEGICASACSFLFVAGKKRQAYGLLGVHQFSSNGAIAGSNAEATSQQITASIADFLKEYDVPMIFFVRMLETPNQGMFWFSAKELADEGLVSGDDFSEVAAIYSKLPAFDVAAPKQEQVAQSASSPTVGPSFDCIKASTSVEFTICSDPKLAELDQVLANRYFNVRASATKLIAKQMLADQRSWLQQRNACGSSLSCLNAVYLDRMAALGF